MKSITTKTDTLRMAVAQSVLKAPPEYIEKLMANDLPKKDVLIIARMAGIGAAKKCPDLIPYCHPLPLDAVRIDYDVQADHILIEASCEAIWKTGVEMEALTAASVAALTIYDMLKPLGQNMEISSTKLLRKKGGKSDFKDKALVGFKAAVLVTSDGTFEGKRKDKSGLIIQKKLEDWGIEPEYIVLPDDKDQIITQMNDWCDKGIQLIFTTGGTGLGPRDVTVEATEQIIDRQIPGIMEAARGYGQRRTPYAMLSRGLAGQKGDTLIINLPGSSKGVEESLYAIFPSVLHSYGMMRGAGH
ncbi:MAG: cyclic pyranopterin phosphate synthase [Candidatus Omnitrophota bacterium]|jgi:cyclic pyranopterin phosphate synthase